jgi:hypothetical protein
LIEAERIREFHPLDKTPNDKKVVPIRNFSTEMYTGRGRLRLGNVWAGGKCFGFAHHYSPSLLDLSNY